MPETSSIRSAVSIELRLMTDRHRAMAVRASIALPGRNEMHSLYSTFESTHLNPIYLLD